MNESVATAVDGRAASRHPLRGVALPSEHGGWGLTVEPGLLGLLVAPSLAGGCLALAAVVAFLARTPLKLALVDRRRGRELPRTVLARRVAAAELLVLAGLVATAVATAPAPFGWPAVVAAPLVGIESWFDVRSKGRRLAPELAGAIGVCSVTAMIVLADGESSRLAAGLWAVLTARVVASIPHVRDQIARLHGRPVSSIAGLIADGTALVVAALAVALDDRLLAGAVAVLAVVVVQRLTARGEIPPAVVLGMHQLALGFGVVLVTAAGVLIA
ncbi:MAG TPA: YwiC-like family protein [Acidimicrobiales bacterium]